MRGDASLSSHHISGTLRGLAQRALETTDLRLNLLCCDAKAACGLCGQPLGNPDPLQFGSIEPWELNWRWWCRNPTCESWRRDSDSRQALNPSPCRLCTSFCCCSLNPHSKDDITDYR